MSQIKSEQGLRKLIFSVILVFGVILTAVAYYLATYERGNLGKESTFSVPVETTPEAEVTPRVTSAEIVEIDPDNVSQILLFANTWSAFGAQIRNELNDGLQNEVQLQIFDPAEAITETEYWEVTQLPSVILVDANNAELVRFEPVSQADLEYLMQEFKLVVND